jgi:regulator of protease activity HflC (stomatin/prohibitin superfamily)
MFERLLDALINGWHLLRPFFIVRAFERGVVLRLGKFQRELEPGLHWKIPVIDEPIEFTACITTVRLPAQSLTTKDDVQVTVAAIVKYEITSAKSYATEIWDQHDVLADVTMGAIRRLTAEREYANLVSSPPENEILTAVRKEVNRYGFKIHGVTFTTFTRARPLMLLNQQALLHLDN